MNELMSWIDVDTLLLLFSMMIIVGVVAETGVFDWLAVYAYKVTCFLRQVYTFYIYVYPILICIPSINIEQLHCFPFEINYIRDNVILYIHVQFSKLKFNVYFHK